MADRLFISHYAVISVVDLAGDDHSRVLIQPRAAKRHARWRTRQQGSWLQGSATNMNTIHIIALLIPAGILIRNGKEKKRNLHGIILELSIELLLYYSE